MWASYHGKHDIVRILLQGGADVNAQNEVRNQMMMIMMMIIIILTIIMMMLMTIVINDEDRDDYI
jgi:hypothetical protein